MEKQPHLSIPLWPGAAPGSESWDQTEYEAAAPFDPRVSAVFNVTQPCLVVYPAEKPSGTAVIVAPGGGFRLLAIQHEGRQVAEWLSAHGITAFLLKYRIARWDTEPAQADRRAMQEVSAMALADAQQAFRLVRLRAAEWDIAAQRVGVMGFSAGGVVASLAALHYTPDVRPDFAAVIYGALFTEFVTPADAPPLFLLAAQDDELASPHSLRMYTAWKEANRPVELHLYGSGGHGFGMHKLGLPSDTWIERFTDWLQGLGM